MKTHAALLDARKAVDDLKKRAAELAREAQSASAEFTVTDAEMVKLLGLQRLGEGDAKSVKVAHERRQAADDAVRGIESAVEVLASRLPAAQAALSAAEAAFYNESADLCRAEHERLKKAVHDFAEGLGRSLREFTRVHSIVCRIPRGVVTGEALMRALDRPFDLVRDSELVDIQTGFVREPARLSIDEVLAIASRSR